MRFTIKRTSGFASLNNGCGTMLSTIRWEDSDWVLMSQIADLSNILSLQIRLFSVFKCVIEVSFDVADDDESVEIVEILFAEIEGQ